MPVLGCLCTSSRITCLAWFSPFPRRDGVGHHHHHDFGDDDEEEEEEELGQAGGGETGPQTHPSPARVADEALASLPGAGNLACWCPTWIGNIPFTRHSQKSLFTPTSLPFPSPSTYLHLPSL